MCFILCGGGHAVFLGRLVDDAVWESRGRACDGCDGVERGVCCSLRFRLGSCMLAREY